MNININIHRTAWHHDHLVEQYQWFLIQGPLFPWPWLLTMFVLPGMNFFLWNKLQIQSREWLVAPTHKQSCPYYIISTSYLIGSIVACWVLLGRLNPLRLLAFWVALLSSMKTSQQREFSDQFKIDFSISWNLCVWYLCNKALPSCSVGQPRVMIIAYIVLDTSVASLAINS